MKVYASLTRAVLLPAVWIVLASALGSGATLPAEPTLAAQTTKQSPAAIPPSPFSDPNGVMNLYLGPVGMTDAATSPPWTASFANALKAAQSGKTQKAKALFQNFVAAWPMVGAGWANLGILEAKTGNNPAAIEDLHRAIRCATDSHETYNFYVQLTVLEVRQQNWSAAVEASRQAYNLAAANSPQRQYAATYLGVGLMHLRKFSEAADVLASKPTVPGEPPEAGDARLIFALEEAGKFPEALKAAEAMDKKYPRSPRATNAYLALGDSAEKNGEYLVGLNAYQLAYEQHPEEKATGFKVVAGAVQLSTVTTDPNDRARLMQIATNTLEEMTQRFPDDPKVHFQLGLLFFSQQSTDQKNMLQHMKRAEDQLRAAAVKDPTNATYVTQLGLAVVLQGPDRLEDGIHLLQGAEKLDPKYGLAHFGLGFAYEQKAQSDKPSAKQHYAEALGEYDTAIALNRRDDNDAKVRRRKIGILYTLGNKTEAYKEFDQLIDRYPGSYGISALAEMGSLLVSDKMYDRAVETYLKLEKLTPKDPSVYVNVGHAEEYKADLAGAESQYRKALTVEPSCATAAFALGNLLKREKRPQDALAVYEAALKAATTENRRYDTESEDAANSIRMQLASDYAMQGKLNDALHIYDTLTLRKDDPNRSIYELQAPNFLIAHSRFAEAESRLTEIVHENPKDDEAAYDLATAQEQNKHADAALATLTTIESRYPTDIPNRVRALEQIGDLQVRLNHFAEGAKAFEEVLELDPAKSTSLNDLSSVRQKQGHPEQAGAFLEGLVLQGDKHPNSDLVNDLKQLYLVMDRTPDRWAAVTRRIADKFPDDRPSQLGALSTLLGVDGYKTAASRAEAQPIVDRLIKANSRDSDAHYYQGLIREGEGKIPEATAEYTAAVNANYGNGPAIAALKRLNAPVPVAPAVPPGTKPKVVSPIPGTHFHAPGAEPAAPGPAVPPAQAAPKPQ